MLELHKVPTECEVLTLQGLFASDVLSVGVIGHIGNGSAHGSAHSRIQLVHCPQATAIIRPHGLERPPLQFTMSLVDGKVAKLRASCDSCNESKVRCSQTKPSCGRCARQGVACVYGLSRRSHRTAPRVGASRTSSVGDSRSLPDTSSTAGSNTAAGKSRDGEGRAGGSGREDGTSAPEATAALQDKAATAECSFLAGDDFMPYFDADDWKLADTASLDLPMSFDLTFDPPNDLSAAPGKHIDCYLPASTISSPTVGDGDRRDSILGLDGRELEAQSHPNGACDCNDLIAKQLLLLPVQCKEDGASLDTRLAQLKHSINIAEKYISCACASHDEMSISKKPSFLLLRPVPPPRDDRGKSWTPSPSPNVHVSI